MNGKLKIVLFVAAVVLIGVIIGVFKYNKPHLDVKDTDGINVTAVELYNNFAKDSSSANKEYSNNVVIVSGDVTQVNKNQQNQPVVLLKTAIQDASINCTMEGDAGNIKPGDKLTIKGICNGYNSGDADMGIPGDVILIRCYATN